MIPGFFAFGGCDALVTEISQGIIIVVSEWWLFAAKFCYFHNGIKAFPKLVAPWYNACSYRLWLGRSVSEDRAGPSFFARMGRTVLAWDTDWASNALIRSFALAGRRRRRILSEMPGGKHPHSLSHANPGVFAGGVPSERFANGLSWPIHPSRTIPFAIGRHGVAIFAAALGALR